MSVKWPPETEDFDAFPSWTLVLSTSLTFLPPTRAGAESGPPPTPLRRSREELANILPENLGWLLPESVDAFEDILDVDSTAQVQPYLSTSFMVKLAEERGVTIVLSSVEDINYKEDDHIA
ncbi:MAG: hypothetical protein M1840_006527 [Geoglossum simile]|nr:MAG: hypothetical protein M1840_006527 [Geoglossum simile]